MLNWVKRKNLRQELVSMDLQPIGIYFGHDMRDVLRAYGVHPIYHTEESIAFVQALDAQAQALGLAAFDDGYRGSGY